MFNLNIITDNAAFHENDASDSMAVELARILRHLATRLEAGDRAGRCIDSNGNTVGEWWGTKWEGRQ